MLQMLFLYSGVEFYEFLKCTIQGVYLVLGLKKIVLGLIYM